MRSSLNLFLTSVLAVTAAAAEVVCVVEASSTDSAPAIVEAFEKCGHNVGSKGSIIFTNTTYVIASVMNTTGLSNVDIYINGTLEWDNSDIDYWLENSLDVGYQNMTSAWLLGGRSVTWQGYGVGTFNGNGQDWYDFTDGASNYPGRPHQITFTGIKDSVIRGLRFVQSQMWTMTVIHASNVVLEDIYVRSVSNDSSPVGNTDGADTIYASDITFRNWYVDNGDDSISLKANSTNILIENCVFDNGNGIAIGSIGQYDGVYETIENVYVRNVTARATTHAVYFKTWTGEQVGYPPNGGGGGLGYARNMTFEDFSLHKVNIAFSINQCTSFNGQVGDCDSSLFNFNNVTLKDFSGSINYDSPGEIQCSAAAPCYDFTFENFNVTYNSAVEDEFECDSVEDYTGFTCTDD